MKIPSSLTQGVMPPPHCFLLPFEDVSREVFVEMVCHSCKDTSLRDKLTKIPSFPQMVHYRPVVNGIIQYGKVSV